MSVSGVSGTTTTDGTKTATTPSALSTLSGNDFLTLLMTQLQNQDPTSPMNTDTFTQELVAFASLEQQTKTNSNLTSIIQITQSDELINATSIVGHEVEVSASQISLQDGSGKVRFSAPSAGSVDISVYDPSGAKIDQQEVGVEKGDNVWTWNGRESSGATAADGAYTVSVATSGSDSTPLPFTVIGRATGVTANGGTLNLELGALDVDFSAVRGVAD